MTDHLSDLLDRVADDAPALRAGLVSDSMRRGTRLRHRRTAIRLAGTSALVAAVAVGIMTLPGGDNTRLIEPAPTPSETVAPELTLREAARDTFSPYGSLSDLSASGPASLAAGYGSVDGLLTTTAGTPAQVSASLSSLAVSGFPMSMAPVGDPAPSSCADIPTGGPYGDACHEVDGMIVFSYRIRYQDDNPADPQYGNVVEVLHPDGFISSARSSNFAVLHSGDVIEKPLLDVAQLEEIATSALWRQVELGE